MTSVTFADGTAIEERKEYRGLSVSFLLSGGDDFKDVMGKVYNLRGKMIIGEMRDVLRPQLMRTIEITEEKVYDPAHPRLIIDHI